MIKKEEEYRPIRVLRPISVIGTDKEKLIVDHPNLSKVELAVRETGTFIGYYTAGQVVDAPSQSERELLLHNKKIAVEIPQHAHGFDLPTSNLARSRKGSHKGREKWRQEMGRKRIKEKQARIKQDKEKVARAVAKAEKASKADEQPVTKGKKAPEIKESKKKRGDNE